ncbi:hypothetical protein D3C80_1948860 [compost metagenome]
MITSLHANRFGRQSVVSLAVLRFFYDFYSCSIAGQYISVLGFCYCGLKNLDEQELILPYAKFEHLDF